MIITLDLTDEEAKLLRKTVSDLGLNNKESLNLQLKVANGILDGIMDSNKYIQDN